MNEESWALIGGKVGKVWVGTRRWRTEGEPHTVSFPADKVLARFFNKRDVIGFEHTHPTFTADPSSLDVSTMQAWVFTLGRPLICVIRGTDGTRGYLFPDDESIGIEMLSVVDIGFGRTIGIDNGRPANSRERIPWRPTNRQASQV